MTIRAATRADDPFILGFVERFSSFPLPAGRDRDTLTAGIRRDIERHLRERPSTSHFFVIEHGGERAGFVHLQEVDDFFGAGSFCHVSDLAISREHEGMGIGAQATGAQRGIRARTGLRKADPQRIPGQRTRAQALRVLRLRTGLVEAGQAAVGCIAGRMRCNVGGVASSDALGAGR